MEHPDIALKTYRYLRIGMLAMLAALAISVVLEMASSAGCWQQSISAYYYTPARAVFVGALVALGLAMVALWGRNPAEDAFLNLAGLCAAVVAFVPTADANYCSIRAAQGTRLEDIASLPAAERAADVVVDSSRAAIDNNVMALLLVVGVALVALGAVAAKNRTIGSGSDPASTAYTFTFVAAVGLWAAGLVSYVWYAEAFYEKAHFTSAVAMFASIIVVVLANAYDRTCPPSDEHEGTATWLARLPRRLRSSLSDRYGMLAVAMVASAAGIVGLGVLGGWAHWVLVVEADLLVLFAAFWAMQTRDRWHSSPPSPAHAPRSAPDRTTERVSAEPVPDPTSRVTVGT